MTDASERPQTYSSPAIRARRTRILEETRRMIAEEGLAALNMNEIGKRAGVAKRTLYNAFQTRERMIATAIQEYFEEFVERIPYVSEPGTLSRNLERMVFVIHRNRRIRNYIRAIFALYFNPETDEDIRSNMHGMAARSNLEWMRNVAAAKQLQPWSEAEQLADTVVRLEYSIINEWAQERLADDQILPRLLTSYLTFVAGAIKGSARKEVETLLSEIAEHGADWVVQNRIRPVPLKQAS